MFDREYENPMVLDDYGEEDTPDQTVTCPGCGRVWEGYETAYDTEWNCGNDAYASSSIYPVVNGKCRACVWENRTNMQDRAYIKARDLKVSVIEHFLCYGGIGRIDRQCNVEELYDIMSDTTDDGIRDWLDNLIDDYIIDEAEFDFVDWAMEGETDNVRNGNPNK